MKGDYITCESCREDIAEDYRKRTKRRLEKGLCPACGGEKENPDSYFCQKCNDKRVKASAEVRKKRKEKGLCPQCGNEIKGDYNLCEDCRQYHLQKIQNKEV